RLWRAKSLIWAFFEEIAGIFPVMSALFHDVCSLSGIFPVIFSYRYSYCLYEDFIEHLSTSRGNL
ncbi:hypothetical protein ABE096_20340, partial [Robertmurraya massiliosenegalensis]|uniref:hypothetical protein n=1 Tax=Robertmurraya massiliosenegalensis TaxID=1287657 RepID=UPI003D29B1D5